MTIFVDIVFVTKIPFPANISWCIILSTVGVQKNWKINPTCPETREEGIFKTGSIDHQIRHRQQIKTRIIRPNGYWYQPKYGI